jgi:hypothetical protein
VRPSQEEDLDPRPVPELGIGKLLRPSGNHRSGMSQTRLPDTGVGHCTLDLHGHDSQESTCAPKVEDSAQVANPGISSNSRPDQNYETQMRRRGHVTGKMLRDNFHLPLHTVAKKFGMCTTAFKKLCRRFEIAKWPHRQVSKL